MSKKPKILVCPLDWGIGHATRCVPIIKELIRQDAEVTIGVSNRPLAFLQMEFPGLTFINFPGYEISYTSTGNGMVLSMLKQFPGLLRWIRKEHNMLDRLIDEHHFDGIISDNRFGLYSDKIPSIYITHQVFIKTPLHLKFLEPFITRINRNFIQKYHECWIPDIAEQNNLSGDLSHKKPLPSNYHFIGPLSRFDDSLIKNKIRNTDCKNYDVLVLLSGPEPQRSILENKILSEIKNSDITAAIVCGKPEMKDTPKKLGKSDIFPHLETQSLLELIHCSKLVISRSGYSTIMDLAAMGNKAVLIPTPGQTEQKYLAKTMQQKGIYQTFKQSEFSLEKVLKRSDQYSGIKLESDKTTLKSRIANFLK